jgi:hypothetical protein
VAASAGDALSVVNGRNEFRELLHGPEPILALAPMQDVTDLPFMRLISGYAPGETLQVRLLLQDSCIGVLCDPASTCDQGRCIPAEMPIDSLRDAGPTSMDGGEDSVDGGMRAEF